MFACIKTAPISRDESQTKNTPLNKPTRNMRFGRYQMKKMDEYI